MQKLLTCGSEVKSDPTADKIYLGTIPPILASLQFSPIKQEQENQDKNNLKIIMRLS